MLANDTVVSDFDYENSATSSSSSAAVQETIAGHVVYSPPYSSSNETSRRNSNTKKQYINYWTNERVWLDSPPVETAPLKQFISLDRSTSIKLIKYFHRYIFLKY